MVSVLVVGAGIIGTALADRLASEGVPVTLVDSGDVGAGTTRTSLAWLNSNHKRPRSYHEFNVAGMAAWRELAGGVGNARRVAAARPPARGGGRNPNPGEGHRGLGLPPGPSTAGAGGGRGTGIAVPGR